MGDVVVTGFEVVEPMVDGRSARVRVTVRHTATQDDLVPAGHGPEQAARLDPEASAAAGALISFRARHVNGGPGGPGGNEAGVMTLRRLDDDERDARGMRVRLHETRTFELLVDPNGSLPGAVFDLAVNYRIGPNVRVATHHDPRIVTKIFHDPRPEVLALLGLAARVQDLASTAYTLLKQEGQTLHRQQQTTMPQTPTDAVRTVLDRDNYSWVLRGVEVGTQLFNLRRNASRGDSDGSGGSGTR